MATNKDGLEPGQPVDFETIQRVEADRARKAREPKPKAPKPKPAEAE